MFMAFRYLFSKPEAFTSDPYGYLTNQLGHGVLGVMLCTALSWTVYRTTGYWVPQSLIVLFVVASYATLWESLHQGWRGWDTLQDTMFVAYGSSLFLFIDMFYVIDRMMGFVLGAIALLSYGVTKRLRRGRFDV